MSQYINKYWSKLIDFAGSEYTVNLKKKDYGVPISSWDPTGANGWANTGTGANWSQSSNSILTIFSFTGSKVWKKSVSILSGMTVQVKADLNANIVAGSGPVTFLVNLYDLSDSIVYSAFQVISSGSQGELNIETIASTDIYAIGIQATAPFSNVNASVTNFEASAAFSYEIEYYNLSALTHRYRGDEEQIDNSVHGSEMYFSFYVEEGENYDELLESNYKDWQLEVLKGTDLYWIGWVKPENITRPFITPAYTLDLSAVDGLADLKSLEFPSDSITGFEPIINIIQTCLSQTGIELDIEVQNNIRELDLVAEFTSMFSTVEADTNRFVKDVNGKVTYTNCYDALKYLLTPFNCRLIQSGGKYVITQKNEINSYRYTYPFSLVTYGISGIDRTIDISNYHLLANSDELSKIAPLKKYELTLFNRNTGENVLYNGSFDTGVSGWTNGTFNTFGWSSLFGGTLRVNEEDIEEGDNFYFTSPVFSSESLSSEDKLILTVDINVSNIVFSDLNIKERMPFVQIRMYYPDASHNFDMEELQEGLHNYRFEFPLIQTGNYYFRVYINTGSETFDAYTVYFDNFAVTQQYQEGAESTHDKYYLGVATGSTAVQVNSDEIYFGDSYNANDIAALKVGATGLTSSWVNYGAVAPVFGNSSFDAGSVSPWYEVGSGTAWSYLGGLSNDVRANGTVSSKGLVQDNFRPGRYTVTFSAKNDNTVSTGYEPNGFLEVVTYDSGTTSFTQIAVVYVTRNVGYSTYTAKFKLNKTSTVGFRVFRAGPGSHLDMSVSQFQVTSYSGVDYGVNLQQLLIYNRMVQSAAFKNYLRLTLKTSSASIGFNNTLQIGSRKYHIVAYSNDISKNYLELGLVEYLNDYIDVSISAVSLETIDGAN